MKTTALPKCLECHCCKHRDVLKCINRSRPHTLLHTNLLLSQAGCKLPKYLPCSCQHLYAQQLERLWCISSVSFRSSAEHPFPEGQRALIKKKRNKLKTKPVLLHSMAFVVLYHERSKHTWKMIWLQDWKERTLMLFWRGQFSKDTAKYSFQELSTVA